MTIPLLNQWVLQDFERARRRAFWRDLISWLTRKNNNLLSFDQVHQGQPLTKRYYRGLQSERLNYA